MTFYDKTRSWIKQQSDEAERRLETLGNKYDGYSLEDLCKMARDEMNEWNPSDEELAQCPSFIIDWKYNDWSTGFWIDPSTGSLLKDVTYVVSAVEWNVCNLYEFAKSRGKVKLEPIRYLVPESSQLNDVIYIKG